MRWRILAGHVLMHGAMCLRDVAQRLDERADALIDFAVRVDPDGGTAERLRSDYATLAGSVAAESEHLYRLYVRLLGQVKR